MLFEAAKVLTLPECHPLFIETRLSQTYEISVEPLAKQFVRADMNPMLDCWFENGNEK